jgi:hypothetical protein
LLGLAHLTLEPERQSIMVVARREDRVLVDDHDVCEPAQLEQAMPVGG